MANQSKLSSQDKSAVQARSARRIIEEPPISLEKKVRAYEKGKCVNVKCRTNPSDSSSTTYELAILYFRNGNSKEWLEWTKDIK